ncbi:hypothetical protein C8Q73DRAFT_89248 [Cubamyces lactineus]|nr:hypothetical protein C8Q73DRAFT_89248 [Cubamyces lactineus]
MRPNVSVIVHTLPLVSQGQHILAILGNKTRKPLNSYQSCTTLSHSTGTAVARVSIAGAVHSFRQGAH